MGLHAASATHCALAESSTGLIHATVLPGNRNQTGSQLEKLLIVVTAWSQALPKPTIESGLS
jgi:hypothetical protein